MLNLRVTIHRSSPRRVLVCVCCPDVTIISIPYEWQSVSTFYDRCILILFLSVFVCRDGLVPGTQYMHMGVCCHCSLYDYWIYQQPLFVFPSLKYFLLLVLDGHFFVLFTVVVIPQPFFFFP